jgi:hypothetical protein
MTQRRSPRSTVNGSRHPSRARATAELPLGADVIGQTGGRQRGQAGRCAERLRRPPQTPPVPVGIDGAGGAPPDLVIVGVDRAGTQDSQVMVRRHDRASRLERFRHSHRPRRHPLVHQSRRGGGADAVAGRRAERRHDIAPARPTVWREGEHAGEAVLVENGSVSRHPSASRLELERDPDRCGPALPAGLQVGERLAGRLGGTGSRPGDAGATARACPGFVHVAADVRTPGREFTEQLERDPYDFCAAPGRSGPPHPQSRHQRGAQVCLVDRRGGHAVRVDPASVAGSPTAVGAMDDVGQQHVAVHVRVTIAAHPVGEDGGHGARGREHLPGRARASGGGDAVLLEIRERPLDRLGMGGDDGVRRIRTAQCEQHTGRLGRAEGQIVGRHRVPSGPEHHSRDGMPAREQTPEAVRVDRSREPEPGGRFPGPTGRPGQRQLAGEIGEVVIGFVPAYPVDPEHCDLPSPDLVVAGVNGRPSGPTVQGRRVRAGGGAPRSG